MHQWCSVAGDPMVIAVVVAAEMFAIPMPLKMVAFIVAGTDGRHRSGHHRDGSSDRQRWCRRSLAWLARTFCVSNDNQHRDHGVVRPSNQTATYACLRHERHHQRDPSGSCFSCACRQDVVQIAKSASCAPDASAADMLTMLLLALVIVISVGQEILRVQRQPTS